MKKNLFFKTLLIAIGLLVTSLTTQMWAATTVYFKNTLGWSNVYVYFYSTDYWDAWKGSGSSGIADGPQTMTYNSSLGLYTYTTTKGNYTRVAFTKDSQSNYGDFYNTEAVYRSDYSASSPIYIPSTVSTGKLNNNTTPYYNTGNWVSLTTRTVYLVSDWATPYAYAFNEYGEQVAWHGTAMTATAKKYGGKTIYSFTTLYDASNIIFNDNESNQTSDLDLGATNAGKIYVNGTGWVAYAYDQAVTVSSDANGSVNQEGTVTLSGAGTTLTATATYPARYVFDSWTISGGGITPSSSSTNPETFKATTSGGTIRANFKQRWAIEGEKSGGSWTTLGVLDFDSGTSFKKSIHLDGNSTYQFIVRDRSNNDPYKNESAFVGQTTSITMSTSATADCHIATAEGGDYIFEFDGSSHALTITYPTVTHPTANYVYYDNSGKSWSPVRVHVYTGETAISKDWNSRPYPSTCTINSKTYYYAAIGGETSVIFSDEDGGEGKETPKKTDASSNKGKYIKFANSTWSGWTSFVFDVTLNRNGGTINAGNVTNYTFGTGATLPTDVTKTGYSFDGWFDNVDLTGSAITTITTTDNGDKTYWAKWRPVTLTLSTTGNWNDNTKWSPGCVPTIDHDVVIAKPVAVNTKTAVAKSVKIYNDGSSHTGKLTINAGQALVVAGTVKRTENGSTEIATKEEDIIIDSDLSNGNGALIMKSHNGTNKATVNFATKAYKKDGASKNWVNQYVGTPFNDQGDPTYNYYGLQLYAFDAVNQAWENNLATSVTAFRGYDLLSRNATQNVVLNMTGTLVESGSSMTQTVSGVASGKEVMFANSWVAPIKTSTLAGAFTGANAVIYIFNAGTLSDYETNSGAITSASKSKTSAGQYTTIAVNDIPSGYTTIPSMQAFSVIATGTSVSLACLVLK